MLAGANDVTVPSYFVPRMKEYSDDGKTFHGAYGRRWRRQDIASENWSASDGGPAIDQLRELVELLKDNPTDRRAVLQIWNADKDLNTNSKDIPCNTMAKFDIRDGQLCMVVFNRSNDIIWGCYGANAVQFSVLQEYLAARIGVLVGWYEQVSTDFHAYSTEWDKHWFLVDTRLRELLKTTEYPNEYDGEIGGNPPGQRIICTMPLVQNSSIFDAECIDVIESVREETFQTVSPKSFKNPIFSIVALPMYQAYRLYRSGDPVAAVALLDQAIERSAAVDWLVAARMWMMRRAVKKSQEVGV